MKIRDANGVERTLSKFIRDSWGTTNAESDAAAASMARLLRVLWRMGQIDEEEIFNIISGNNAPEGMTIVDKPDRGVSIDTTL